MNQRLIHMKDMFGSLNLFQNMSKNWFGSSIIWCGLVIKDLGWKPKGCMFKALICEL